MKFGEITFDKLFGGYELVNIPASSIPQEAASAVFGAINSGLLGSTYVPIWYVGSQLVNGKNHFFIAKEIRSTKNKDTSIVGLIINVPLKEGPTHAKVVEIIEEAHLSDELKCLFDRGLKNLVGVNYKPLCYVGHQVTKGTNHYFIAEARCVYPGAEPYPVLVCLNDFNNQISIVFITKLEDFFQLEKSNYAFTW